MVSIRLKLADSFQEWLNHSTFMPSVAGFQRLCSLASIWYCHFLFHLFRYSDISLSASTSFSVLLVMLNFSFHMYACRLCILIDEIFLHIVARFLTGVCVCLLSSFDTNYLVLLTSLKWASVTCRLMGILFLSSVTINNSWHVLSTHFVSGTSVTYRI